MNKDQSIITTMNLVAADLAAIGIAKDQKNTQQNYSYRGIDPLYDTLAPICAKHGLIILPDVEEYHRENGSTKNGTLTVVVWVRVRYKFTHIHNKQFTNCVFFGEAIDYSDKATNKAITAAYKYMVIQTFNIPINGTDNDADNTTPEQSKPADKKATPKKIGYTDKELTDFINLFTEPEQLNGLIIEVVGNETMRRLLHDRAIALKFSYDKNKGYIK